MVPRRPEICQLQMVTNGYKTVTTAATDAVPGAVQVAVPGAVQVAVGYALTVDDVDDL